MELLQLDDKFYTVLSVTGRKGTMKSERGLLRVGGLYELHTSNPDHKGYVLECLRILTDDYYSPYSAVVRSTITGWTMIIHGTNIYEDGTIDWDYSTNGYFSTKEI